MNRTARLVAGMVLAAGAASAQPAPQPTPPADQSTPPASRPGATVIHPPASVDPGMKVTPKPTSHLPTPVIRPPVQKGDTVIVPR